MISLDNSFLSYVDRVLLSRDVTPAYAAKVRYCCRAYCRWLTCDPGIDGLDCIGVNEFLSHLQVIGKKPETVAGYRRALLVVWNEAYRDGANDCPPLRVRRIKTPRHNIQAYSHEKILTLLNYVAALKAFFPNGVRRSDFWEAAIRAAYSTGLRRGDLLKLKRSDIGQGGIARVLQNKTGYPVTVRVSAEALAAIDRMKVSELALPWPYHENALSRQFRRLAVAAGVGGQFRWLRRSSGSYAERDCPGNGRRMLGHQSDRIFRVHYEDHEITGQTPVDPPELPEAEELFLTRPAGGD